MISKQQNTECLTRLGMLKFFPVKEGVLAEIGKLLNELCQNDHEAKRLTNAILTQFSEWPGPSKILEVHATEIVPRRVRETGPNGCERCCEIRAIPPGQRFVSSKTARWFRAKACHLSRR